MVNDYVLINVRKLLLAFLFVIASQMSARYDKHAPAPRPVKAPCLDTYLYRKAKKNCLSNKLSASETLSHVKQRKKPYKKNTNRRLAGYKNYNRIEENIVQSLILLFI